MKIISNCWPTVTKPAVPISCKLTTTFTYGEFKGYWFGSYRWFHHCDFKQRCKQQKLLLLSQETLRRKITSLKWWAENSQQFRNLKKSCIVCCSFLYVCREGKSRNKTMRKDQIWSQCWKQNKKYVYIYIFLNILSYHSIIGTHLWERVDLLDIHSRSLWYLNTRLPWLIRSTSSLRCCCYKKEAKQVDSFILYS